MNPTEEVSNLINCLTQNEDQRQELWIHYLSGNNPSSFISHLTYLRQQNKINKYIEANLGQILRLQQSNRFCYLLNHFSDIEKSIIYLLVIGLTTQQIASYKSISEVRIKHVVSIIRYNPIWKELYNVHISHQ